MIMICHEITPTLLEVQYLIKFITGSNRVENAFRFSNIMGSPEIQSLCVFFFKVMNCQ